MSNNHLREPGMSNSRLAKSFKECLQSLKSWGEIRILGQRQGIIWAKQIFVHRKRITPPGESSETQKND